MIRKTRTPDDSQPVVGLLNLGPSSGAWLMDVGLKTAGDLKKLGAVAAFMRVKSQRKKVSLILLYAIQGAITGTHWAKLNKATKAKLKRDLGTL